jgi:hypothetical protein
MSRITNDVEFRQALQGLDPAQQRLVAAKFLEHVLPLSTDDRVRDIARIAADSEASSDALTSALKTAKSATFDSHTRCGSEGNWKEQAGYFVCRAAVAAVTPPEQITSGSPAWQAAMSCRMAQTSVMIDETTDEISTHMESEWQYKTLSDQLNAQ